MGTGHGASMTSTVSSTRSSATKSASLHVGTTTGDEVQGYELEAGLRFAARADFHERLAEIVHLDDLSSSAALIE